MWGTADNGFELVWDANCATGESPVWDAGRGLLWFCDSPACRLLAYEPANGARHRFQLSEPVGSLGLTDNGTLIVALRHQIVIFDPETGQTSPFAIVDNLPSHVRLNDGKVGPDGAFWVGAVDMRPKKEPIAKLYRVTPDGQIQECVDSLIASNGLAWSSKGETMYLSDSRAQWIDAWDFDTATGSMTNRRRIASLTAEEGRPDGAACDTDGYYWSAGVSAGCLNKFAPDGQLAKRYPTPVPTPTMPCFVPGYIYLTSLWAGVGQDKLRSAPQIGGLFRMPTSTHGVPIERFNIAEKG